MDFSSDTAIREGMKDAMKRKQATRALIHNAFPGEGTIQPNHMGSQSMAPNAPTTPEMMAPRMPNDLSTQMSPSGEY